MGNLPTFDQIAAMQDGEVVQLSIETFRLLQENLAERKAALARDTALFQKSAAVRFNQQIAREYADKDSGKVTLIDADEFAVKAERKKSVEWDQEFLAAETKAITDAGDDPAIYIKPKTTYTIGEATYKDWPEKIKAHFQAGRTVKIAPTVITIEPKKAK